MAEGKISRKMRPGDKGEGNQVKKNKKKAEVIIRQRFSEHNPKG